MLSGRAWGAAREKTPGLGELDLTLDDDLSFEDSQLRLDEAGPNKGRRRRQRGYRRRG